MPAMEGVNLAGELRMLAQIFPHQIYRLLHLPRLIITDGYVEHTASASFQSFILQKMRNYMQILRSLCKTGPQRSKVIPRCKVICQ